MDLTPPFGPISSCLFQSSHKSLHRTKSIEIHLLNFRALEEPICYFFPFEKLYLVMGEEIEEYRALRPFLEQSQVQNH